LERKKCNNSIGKLGSAILQGLLQFRNPELRISHITVTTQTLQGVNRIKNTIAFIDSNSTQIELGSGENSKAAQGADVIIIGCKPKVLPKILSELPAQNRGTVLISLAGGVTLNDLARMYRSTHPMAGEEVHPFIVRAIPNIAASLQQSATVCSSLSQDGRDLTTRLFNMVGRTKWVAEQYMYTASALCASSLAFYATMVTAVSSSSEMPVEDALELAALAMQGTASLVLAGRAPEAVICQVATPGGSTEAGLRILETRGVAESLDFAMKETVEATRTMGKGATQS
jgi:pyrroline-5-carboxylate reductase